MLFRRRKMWTGEKEGEFPIQIFNSLVLVFADVSGRARTLQLANLDFFMLAIMLPNAEYVYTVQRHILILHVVTKAKVNNMKTARISFQTYTSLAYL